MTQLIFIQNWFLPIALSSGIEERLRIVLINRQIYSIGVKGCPHIAVEYVRNFSYFQQKSVIIYSNRFCFFISGKKKIAKC